MCVNNLSKVALDCAISSRKFNALTTTLPSHAEIQCCYSPNIVVVVVVVIVDLYRASRNAFNALLVHTALRKNEYSEPI